MEEHSLIGSLAKHGICAAVPNRSFTLTMIISCPTGATAAFFSLFSFSFLGFSPPLNLSSTSSLLASFRTGDLCRPNFASTSSLPLSFLDSASLAGDRCRGRSCSLYPLSNLLSSLPLSSSYRGFSFHLNPPPLDFLGLSSWRRRGERLRSLWWGGRGDGERLYLR